MKRIAITAVIMIVAKFIKTPTLKSYFAYLFLRNKRYISPARTKNAAIVQIENVPVVINIPI